jgi:hypothetical protein
VAASSHAKGLRAAGEGGEAWVRTIRAKGCLTIEEHLDIKRPWFSSRARRRVMAKLAWIGLGVMGYPMAGHIRVKGDTISQSINRAPKT